MDRAEIRLTRRLGHGVPDVSVDLQPEEPFMRGIAG
jgi:hypothetical protein